MQRPDFEKNVRRLSIHGRSIHIDSHVEALVFKMTEIVPACPKLTEVYWSFNVPADVDVKTVVFKTRIDIMKARVARAVAALPGAHGGAVKEMFLETSKNRELGHFE